MQLLIFMIPSEETGESEEGNDGKSRFGYLNKLVQGDRVILRGRRRNLNKKGCEKRDNESEEDESYIRNEFSNTR
jgi:hypothetical protein